MVKKTYHEIAGMVFEEIKHDRYKYRLVKKYGYQTGVRIKKPVHASSIHLMTTGMLWLDAGYMWNGADAVKDTDSNIRGSLIHDPLCTLYHIGKLSKKWIKIINDTYEKICKEDGMPKWRLKLHRAGLFLFWWKRRL